MLITEKKSPVIEKTEELCQTILDQPVFQQLQADLAAFDRDPEAKRLYENVLALQEQLQAKHERGATLSEQEIQSFQAERDSLLQNACAKAYFDAQQQIQQLHDSISRHVGKTLELGRLPTEAELQARSGGGCCGGGGGGGCGCSG